MEVQTIGIIRSPFKEPTGTPIQASVAQDAEGIIEVYPQFVQGLKDLDGFDRIWLLYWFHQAAPAKMIVTPFMDDKPRGLFATRAPCRPNPIGISPVRLLKIEASCLHIADIDVLDGTPLLDIKPYAPKFDHFAVGRVGWMEGAEHNRRLADNRFSPQ
ncbi:MAG: tRNA (N6-threonylcarbamoyladenosine(37)-N6)-methyltransferase TrmO [Dehalococcoidales bacterium]